VPAGAQEATVVRLVDGDTVVLRGRGVGPLDARPTRVRVLLVDTPEVHSEQECLGKQAAARAQALLPEGGQVRVQADRDPEDRFGRALLHVWNADGVNVGEALVREGLAEVLQLDPNELYLDAFEAAEDEARSAQRGLWDVCR
jgi:micrococcal nuclease